MNCYRIHQKSLNFIHPFKFYSFIDLIYLLVSFLSYHAYKIIHAYPVLYALTSTLSRFAVSKVKRSKVKVIDWAVARISFYRGEGRPKSDAHGSGILGEGAGQPAPSHQLRGIGERRKLPQRGPGRSPGRQTVFTRFKCSEQCWLWVGSIHGLGWVGSEIF